MNTEDWNKTYALKRWFNNEGNECPHEIEDMINNLAHHVGKNRSDLFDGRKEFHLTIGPDPVIDNYVEVRIVRRPVDRHMRPEVKDIIRQIVDLNDELNVLNPEGGRFKPGFPGKYTREESIRNFFACEAHALETLERLK